MASHRQAFASGGHAAAAPSGELVCRQGVLEQTFGRCRPAGGAEHVYESAQRDRHCRWPG